MRHLLYLIFRYDFDVMESWDEFRVSKHTPSSFFSQGQPRSGTQAQAAGRLLLLMDDDDAAWRHPELASMLPHTHARTTTTAPLVLRTHLGLKLSSAFRRSHARAGRVVTRQTHAGQSEATACVPNPAVLAAEHHRDDDDDDDDHINGSRHGVSHGVPRAHQSRPGPADT